MATRIWRGDAKPVKQVVTITAGTVKVGRSYALRINNKDVSVIATTTSATFLITNLATAIAASTQAEFKELVATTSGAVLTLTARTAGVTFSVRPLTAGFQLGSAMLFTTSHQPTGGTFTFTPDASDGAPVAIAYNASAATVQGYMDTIYGAGNTLVTLTFTEDGRQWKVEFIGSRANTAVPVATIADEGLTGGDAALEISTIQLAEAGTSCVQTSTHYGTGTGGTRRFGFAGAWATVAFDASTADVQTAMRALITINGANINVTGTPNDTYVFTFVGDLAHRDLPLIEVDESEITGGSIYAEIEVTQAGEEGTNQIYYLEWIPNTDEYTVGRSEIVLTKTTYSGWSAGYWTLDSTHTGFDAVTIPFDATDSEIALLLDTELGIDGAVTVASTSPQIHIYFHGTAAQYALGTVSVSSFITGGSIALTSYESGNNTSTPSLPVADVLVFSHPSTSELSDDVLVVATDEEMQAAIEAMAFCGEGNVSVVTLNVNSYTFVKRIEFRAALGGRDVNFSATGSGANGYTLSHLFQQAGATGTNEELTLTIAGSPSQGSIVLSQSGNATVPILYNELTVGVVSKISAMPHIGAGNLSGTGGALPGTPVVLTYINALSQTNIPTMTIDDNALKVAVVMTTPGVTGRDEVVQLSLVGQEVWAGDVTFTVDSTELDPLDWNGTYADLQALLDSGLGANKATASGGPWPESVLLITYDGDNTETDMDPITATDTLTNGQAALESVDAMLVSIVTNATGPNHWSNPINWANPADATDLVIPRPADAIVFSDKSENVFYGLVQRVSFTASTVDDYLVPSKPHDLQEEQGVHVWTDDTLPAGLAASTMYYVRDLDAFTGKFKLSASIGGTPVDLTDAGTGPHYVGLRLASLVHYSRSTSQIGLPRVNTTGYWEYRPLYLECGVLPSGAKLITIGQGAGSGSQRVNIDTGSDQVVFEVLNSSSGPVPGVPAVLALGQHASNVFKVRGGQCGIAALVGETATLASIELTGGELALGVVSLVTLDKTGGTISFINGMTASGVVSLRA